MNTLKGWISTTCLATLLMASTMTANAGVIIGGIAGEPSDPCIGVEKTEMKSDFGVIIGGLTGVIIGGLTGVIIGGLSTGSNQDCGVIIGG